ncbi:uncharacterized protein METZ01_LOCUS330767 [marine metagenome]|uniref:Uncharacterized protein n=1 Tax=marine metagenome TaxID=408172 RepID=A0A382PX19_9ZZZZ
MDSRAEIAESTIHPFIGQFFTKYITSLTHALHTRESGFSTTVIVDVSPASDF